MEEERRRGGRRREGGGREDDDGRPQSLARERRGQAHEARLGLHRGLGAAPPAALGEGEASAPFDYAAKLTEAPIIGRDVG